jgi:integrase
MLIVYYTGIRPKEVLALRISEIDLKANIITIAPDEERENSKTDKVRRVPINPHVKKILLNMKLNNYPGHYYVFGSPYVSGEGNRGAGSEILKNGVQAYGAMRTGYFLPSENTIKRDTATKLWARVIQADPVYHPVTDAPVYTFYIDPKTGKKIKGSLGIGIKKKLYSAKGTGCDDLTEAGVELKEIQIMYGHQSEAMTARYNKKKRQIEAKKAILEKAPAFAMTPKLKAV